MRKSTIIIPVFNHAALTAQCLKAVCTERGAEVIVVDDASTDHTQQVLCSFGRKLKVLRHKENRGFAVSCNEGAKAATGEYLVFLNNDTVPSPGWLQALERYAAENPEVATVGAKLVYPNDTIQHAGEGKRVVGPMPGFSFDAQAECRGSVYVAEDPGFVITVAPA